MAKYTSMFTGEEIDNLLSQIDSKHGSSYFDPTTMTIYNFRSDADKREWLNGGSDSLILGEPMPLVFTGMIEQVTIVNLMGSNQLYYTTNSGTAIISVGFKSQRKEITDISYEEVFEDFIVTVAVDKGTTGEFINIVDGITILNGNTYSFDVWKHIASGNNRVRIIAKGALTGKTNSLLLTVNLTTMYLSPSNFAWHKPFIEGESYNLGGMNIGGNLQKVLKVKITNEALGYDKTYEENIGTATYITNAYFFNKLVFPETGTGTYHVDIWIEASGLESTHLEYNIMCIAATDVYTATALCINEISSSAVNGSDSTLFAYSVYDKGAAVSSPEILIKWGTQTLVNEILSDVPTVSKQNYSASLEVESEAQSFDINCFVILEDAEEDEMITIDNTASFPAVSGATFYMNAATRSNSQANKDSIINEATGEVISTLTNNIAYVDGADGYTVDDNGRKCLLIPATCSMELLFQPMAAIGNGWTFEAFYKVTNAADFEENIITLATNPTNTNFQGIRIRPTNVCVHSRDLKTNDLAQSYNTKDEEYVHLIITIIKNYKTNYGNLAQIYVNGVKKTSFSFTNTDSFATFANPLLGSQTADLCVYKVRVYNQGFGWQDAVQNYINCLPTQSDKIAAWNKIISILDDSYKVDYYAVKGKKNVMVIEMKDGAVLPDVLHPSGGKCNVTFDFPDVIENELDDDFKFFFSGEPLVDQDSEGQGTTANTYYRWNFLWKLSSAYNKRRITAKKNVASSMQSHKMGATRMYNNLHNAVCGMNEANARVAVFQYPAYGFLKQLVEGTTDQYTYTFIGIYTVGPDKGDKPTFGYNNEEFKDSLMHLEGTDHTPMSVGYDYPWSETKYLASKEAMGAITSSGDIAAAWEVGAAGQLETDSDQDAIQAMLDSEFKPAYECVYNNSPKILGVAETLDEINTDVATWRRNTDANGTSYSELEFYTDGVYDLYYYNIAEGVFKPNGANLLTQFGLSSSDVEDMDMDSRTEYFKQLRRDTFIADIENYWDLDDAQFHETALELIGASDNLKKNNYPYKFKLLTDGGKWKRRQDDLDSIGDINNQGFAAKLFSVLYGDKTSTGSGSVFRGENSVFSTLMRECFPEGKKKMAHRIFDAMVEQSPYGQTKIEKLVGCIRSWFWDKAQDYFTKSAYNADAEWTYEEAWPLRTQGTYVNDVDPLQQSLGDHYEAEVDWFTKRMIFMASYYNWGPFATDNGDDTSTGQISFRAAGGKTYSITPAMDINPTILIGQSDIATAGKRVKAGETVEVVVPDMGNNDTHVYIQGTDYIADLGDLSDLQVSADNPVLTVSSKRMRRLKVGDAEKENVTSNVAQLNMGACPSMESVDARNLSSLTGTVDLTRLPRLKEALFGGTSAANVAIGEGSKLTSLSLPGTLTTLALVKLLNLTEENLIFDDLGNLEYIRLENNAQMDGFEMLKNAYQNSEVLRNIRVVGFDYTGDATDVDMIASFATETDSNGNKKYAGIDDEGSVTTGLPVLDGKLNVTTPVYEDALNAVKTYYPNLNVQADTLYFRLADPEVQRIVAENWGDGVGTTLEQIQTITDIGTKFSQNSAIETFEEFSLFTNAQEVPAESFKEDTALKSIDLSEVTSLGASALYNCTSLEIEDLSLPNLETLGSNAFYGVKIKKISDLGKLTVLPRGSTSSQTFGDRSVLEEVVLPNTLVTISNGALYGYTNCVIEDVNLPNLQTIEGGAFNGTKVRRITSLGSVSVFPTASNNTGYLFQNCTELTYISPSVLENITEYVNPFHGCTSLLIDELRLPNLQTISVIGYGPKIRSIRDLGKITQLFGDFQIGSDASSAYGTPSVVEEFYIPETVESIGRYAFRYLTNLKFIVCYPITPPALNSNAAIDHSSCPIYVPDESVTAYQEATNWSSYADRIYPMSVYEGGTD